MSCTCSSSAGMIFEIIAVVVLGQIIYSLFSLARRLNVIDFKKCVSLKNELFQKYSNQPWALVTGCTSGIGKSLSLLFAQAGFNLILVGRDLERVEVVRGEIGGGRIIVVDLSTEWDVDVVRKQLEGLSIGLWINNAGVISRINKFENIDYSELDHELNVNVKSLVRLSKLAVELRAKTVVQIGSVAPFFNSPDIVNYTSTKAFVNAFSTSLGEENEVDIVCVTPGFVRTKLIRVEEQNPGLDRLNWAVIDADYCANSILNLILRRGSSVCECPSVVQRITVLGVKFLPRVVLRLVGGTSVWIRE